MAANSPLENSFAAWGEAGGVGQKAADGPFYVPVLGVDDVEAEGLPTMTVAASDIERKDYAQENAAEKPTIPGGRSWDFSGVIPARFDGAGTAMECEALLLACGLQVSGNVFIPKTAPLAQHQSAGIAITEGTLFKQGIGAAFNMVWSGKSGDITRFAFTGKAIWLEPEEATMASGTYTVDTIAPPVWDRGVFQLGAGSNTATAPEAAVDNVLSCSEFSFDLGATVSPRTRGNLIHLPVYYAASHDAAAVDISVGTIAEDPGGGTEFVAETTDCNSATTGDVSPFPAATVAVNDGFYAGMPHRFNGLRVTQSTLAVQTVTEALEYWNATTAAWTAVSTSVDQVSSFAGGTGIRYVTWEPPAGWAKATINGVSGYFVRWRVTAYTSMGTKPLLTQVQTLAPAICARYCVTAQAPRLTVVIEQEAHATYNPFEDHRNRSTRTITHQVGTLNNNTLILSMVGASVMSEPEVVREDGLIRYRVTYGAPTSWSLTAT